MRTFLRDERGFTLLDMLVTCAVLATVTLAAATAFGMRPARTHAAAMALEAALSEARSLAAATANATDLLHPTGATVVVEADANVAGATRIAVYRSRPVIFNGQTPYPPQRDPGFPPQRVGGAFTFQGSSIVREPFAILLSGAGYASIVPLRAPYDEAAPTYYSVDPGCAVGDARIVVSDGSSVEEHRFACAGSQFVAN